MTEKKGISKGAVRTIIATVVVVHAIALIGKGCDGASPDMRDVEVYAEKNERCTADNKPEVRDSWIKEAKAITEKIEPVDEDLIVDIDEAFPLYRNKGAKAVKALGKKYVRFPKIEDTLLSVDKCIPVMDQYKKGGVDLAQEIIVDTGLKGTCGYSVLLPKYFWEQIREAAREAGVKEIKIAWGLRDSNLQAIMFVRSTYSKCGEYPSSASEKCMKYVGRNIAGKPKISGFTHFFSADIDNWMAMKKQLLARGFAVGCQGVGEDDERHTTWGISQHDAKLGCTVSTWWKRLKIF